MTTAGILDRPIGSAPLKRVLGQKGFPAVASPNRTETSRREHQTKSSFAGEFEAPLSFERAIIIRELIQLLESYSTCDLWELRKDLES